MSCIRISRPSHGYSLQGAYRAQSGPSLCHSVVTCMCTVARVEENVYKSCGLTESLIYSQVIFHHLPSQAVPCHAMAVALARRTYMLIYELSEVTSRSAPAMAPGVYCYIHIYIHTYIYIQTNTGRCDARLVASCWGNYCTGTLLVVVFITQSMADESIAGCISSIFNNCSAEGG